MKDQLRKGYIRPLKSPQMSLVFFVPKKMEKEDGARLLISKQLDDQEQLSIAIDFWT